VVIGGYWCDYWCGYCWLLMVIGVVIGGYWWLLMVVGGC